MLRNIGLVGLKLPLPLVDLDAMHLILLRQLRHFFVTAQRLKHYLGFELLACAFHLWVLVR
jgi:hypothetical protein